MTTRRAVSGAALLALGALLLTGCTTPYVSEIIEGSELSVGWRNVISEFNGASVTGHDPANTNVLYLTSAHFNHYDSALGVIADTGFGTYAKTNDSPLTVKYRINDNVTWSDGVPIDGADLLLAWAARFAQLEVAGAPIFHHTSPLKDLATATPIVDGRSLTLVYDRPHADWEVALQPGVAAHGTVQLAYPELQDAAEAKRQLITQIAEQDVGWLTPVADAWNTGYQATDTPDNPLLLLSSGPYIVEELVADDHVTLVANAAYTWGPSPKYERVTVRKVAGATAAVHAFEDGDIQLATGSLTPELLELVEGLSNAEYAISDTISFEHIDLTFDNGGPFDAASYGGDAGIAALVRRAFLLAIPRQAILEAAVAPANPDATLRDSLLLMPGTGGYDAVTAANGSAAHATADIEGAKALLAEAGVPTPIAVNFWYPQGDERRAAAFELIVQSAARAGFNLVDKSEPNWAFLDTAAFPVNPHDAMIFAWQPANLSTSGLAEYLGTNERSNYSGYSSPVVDDLLEDLSLEVDRERRAELLLKIEQELWSDGYGVVVYQYPGITWWQAGVSGISTSAGAPSYFWNFWEWVPPAAGD